MIRKRCRIQQLRSFRSAAWVDPSASSCERLPMQAIPILPGLSKIARDYDALICDVWGVLHDGQAAFAPAIEACYRFRSECGPVVLLTNAPRPVCDLEQMFARV